MKIKQQVVLCLLIGLSSVCFGMEQENLWEIGHIIKGDDNPLKTIVCEIEEPMQGKLEVYYARKNKISNYEITARFKPDAQKKAIIKFKNFDDEKYEKVKALGSKSGELHVSPRLYIVKSYPKGISHLSVEAIEITKIEKIQEPEELLDIKRSYYVVTESDCIVLKNSISNERITLYHSENIETIRQALALNKPFILNIFSKNNATQGKVTGYRNGSYIWWNGWIPSFKSLCVGMPVQLGVIDTPENKFVELEREKEELHHYTRNKWISRLPVVALFAFIAYKLKDKLYSMSSFLLE